jgi:hypothetical protein
MSGTMNWSLSGAGPQADTKAEWCNGRANRGQVHEHLAPYRL